MTLRRAPLAIGVVLTLLGVARADSRTPFTTILRAHVQEWGGATGAITGSQLDRLMKRRDIDGDAAAVLAAMKMQQMDSTNKQLIAWTPQRIEKYEAVVAQDHSQNTYDKAYEKALAAIRSDPHTLYVDGAPHLSSIRQARNGDCWLLATIGAMIHRDPHELRKLIRNEGRRQYSVHFADHTFMVNAPTDAEVGAYTADNGDGHWLYVLENAEGQYREDLAFLHHFSEANDDALVVGSGALALKHILGRNSDHIVMAPKKPQHDLVRATLTRAFKERRLVIVGTTHDKTITLPHGISSAHAMAVIGWDAAADEVKIWNPSGKSSEPEGTGPNTGYKTVNGVFTILLNDFTRSFAQIHVENDTP